MNLQDIYDQLTHGELAQVSLGDTNTGKMTEENKAKVIGHINLGLMDLYKKFRLKENEIYVMLHPERNVYYIDNKYISDLCLEDMHFNPKTDTTVLPPRECPPNADVRNAYGDVDKDGVIPEDPEIEVLERNGIEKVTTHGFEYLQQPPDPRSKTPVDNSPPRKYLIEIEGFVDASEVHHTLFDAPYFAGPDGDVAGKTYALLCGWGRLQHARSLKQT